MTNTYEIVACNSVMCGDFCIEFINFMLKAKNLLDCTNVCFTKKYESTDKVILNFFLITKVK